MRRILCLTLTVLLSCFLNHTSSANEIDKSASEIKETFVQYEYVYPITPESDDWFDYTVREKVEMLRIPEQTLINMTDEELIAAIISYPYLVDIYLYSNYVSDGIETVRTYFSALDELLSRDTGLNAIGTYFTSTSSASTMSASPQNHPSYSFEQNALADIYLACNSYQAKSAYREPERLHFILTPNGTDLYPAIYTEEHTHTEHQQIDINKIVSVYGATLIEPGSCVYNCHYFAWHLKGNVNADIHAWLDDPSAYMTDGSYSRIYSGSINTWHYETSIRYGDIIFYGSISNPGECNTWHSAICIYNSVTGGPIASVTCISKWGRYGVFQHAMGNVPAGYDTSHISAWRITEND